MDLLKEPKVKHQVQILGYTRIFGYILALVGLCVLAWNAGWWITIGVLLMFFGNNAASNAALGLAVMNVMSVMLEKFELTPRHDDSAAIRAAAEMIKQARENFNR